MQKGKFVVIDGLDGSGKKTQLDLLLQYCKKKKIKTATVDFPQYGKTFFGKLAGRYLKGDFGNLEGTNPYLASLTFAGDRFQAKPIMSKALEQGKLLLSNRYTSSSMAFMAAKFKKLKEQNEFIKWLGELEQGVYQCPHEDLTIYLSIPPKVGQKLVLNKGKRAYMGNKKSHDIHEQNLEFLKKVQEIYLRIAKNNPCWIKVNCLDKNWKLRTRLDLHQEIIKILQKKKIVV